MTQTERTAPGTKTCTPRFNHVAMSLPADLLDEGNRADIVRFYDEVFGWKELPTMTEDRHRLVLSCYTYEQFVFLIAEETPMTCAAPRSLRDLGRDRGGARRDARPGQGVSRP